MPINLDFVGLNTLVREILDTENNTIGAAKSKCLDFGAAVDSRPELTPGSSAFPALGLFASTNPTGFEGCARIKDDDLRGAVAQKDLAFACWVKLNKTQGTTQQVFQIGGIVLKFTEESIDVKFNTDDGKSRTWEWNINSIDFINNWHHIAVTWTGNFSGTGSDHPVLYINAVSQGTHDTTSNVGSPSNLSSLRDNNLYFIGTQGAVMSPGNTDGVLFGQIQHLVLFYEPQGVSTGAPLSSDEIATIYNNGQPIDLRDLPRSIYDKAYDYWSFSDSQLESYDDGEILSVVTIKSLTGRVDLVAVAAVVKKDGLAPDARIRTMATIPYSGSFNAILTHRNGPYGTPTFKQIRASENPLTRYQKLNNIFSTLDTPQQRETTNNLGQVVSRHSDKHGAIINFEEPVITCQNKPISSIVNAKYEDEFETIEEKLVVKTTFSNETSFFKNQQLNVLKNKNLNNHPNYDTFKDMYIVDKQDDNIIDNIETIKLEQTIYPTNLQVTKKETRLRPNFVSGYWREAREDRSKDDVLNGFIDPDKSIPQAVFADFSFNVENSSIWPMDNHGGVLGPKFTYSDPVVGGIVAKTNLVALFKTANGYGALQNPFCHFTNDASDFGSSMTSTHRLDNFFTASCVYNRRHSLTSSTSVCNPAFISKLSSSTIFPPSGSHRFAGTAYWQAPEFAGYFDATGSFVSRPKEPFYDTYADYAEEFRGVGKQYAIIPEFLSSNHVEFFLTNGPLETKTDILEISGGLDSLNNSSQDSFYKTYSNSDFLKHFEIIKQDHSDIFDPFKVTLKCKAIKKFLPYDGFYPCQRTVTLAQQFYSASAYNIALGDKSADTNFRLLFGATDDNLTNYLHQYLLNPLFAPGVLFNTIKAGVACDYPLITSTPQTQISTTGSDFDYVLNNFFDTRIPFEALIEPQNYLANIHLRSNEPNPFFANHDGSIFWNGSISNLYRLQMENFLAEVGNFFLESENFTTITSLPQGDPNFGNAKGDKVYMMRLKMYRTTSGLKLPQTASNGVLFSVPQDVGGVEDFTMYSRPSAFGPPSHTSASSFQVKAWSKFKNEDSINFSYDPDNTYIGGIGLNSQDGYNFSYTPPYYHGEAWADITFKPPSGTKKYTLNEIINNSSIEFYRFFQSGSQPAAPNLSPAPFTSGTVLVNERAMQLASSMNIFSKGVLREDIQQINNITVDTQFENKYRWIMQTKFETPMLNFNEYSHNQQVAKPVKMPLFGTSSVPIGMWHQYGKLPRQSDEGVFVQIQDIPNSWIEGATLGDINKTGSLAEICGFATEPLRLGEVKDTKIIEEAVVAIPFVDRDGERVFFEIDKQSVKDVVDGQPEKTGKTIRNLVSQMRKYVFPPQFDFINNTDIKSIAMYVFEFSHTLTKQDLADIWQNLPPTIGVTHETAESSISHELFSQEFFGSGPVLDESTGNLKKITPLSQIPSDIKWMVFKVKKRAETSYFRKIFEKNESGADISSDEIVATALGKRQKISYNWPYDFFSLVELIKLDASIEFGNIDTEKSIELNQTFIKPYKVKPE